MEHRNEPTRERLIELLHYNPNTGVFKWHRPINPRCRKDLVAGSRDRKRGYIYIGIDGVVYLAHRLAWLYIHGDTPTTFIDHIDGNGDNNRIANLRVAGKDENSWNSKISGRNKSGYKGVFQNAGDGRWIASVTIYKKRVFRKAFATRDEAVSAVRLVRENLHKEFANHG